MDRVGVEPTNPQQCYQTTVEIYKSEAEGFGMTAIVHQSIYSQSVQCASIFFVANYARLRTSWRVESRVYNKPISKKRHSDKRDRRKRKSLKQRGPIVLIIGGVLFVAGPIIAVVWAIQFASTFADTFLQQRDKLINQVSIEPGGSVEAATTQVTDISKPVTVGIHIQRLGEREAGEGDGLGQQLQQQQLPREQREAKLIATV